MKKFALIGMALAFAAICVADDQSYLALLAETKVMRMAGMRPIKMPKLPPGIKIPAGAMAMASGEPARTLNVRLWTPSIAPDGATAYITPPQGLMQGDKLNLDLYRPQPSEGQVGGPGGSGGGKMQDMTILIYWGSSATVKEGQPKVIHFGGLSPEQQQAIEAKQRESQRAAGAASYFYKPGWTTGYWPTPEEPGSIDKDASLVGNYSLTSTYAGNVSIDAPSNVDFLAPIEMTAPDLGEKIDLNNAIAFQWNQIPNLLGQFASIMGMQQDKNTIVIWTSSEVERDQVMADMGFMQMSEVKDLVGQTVFMPGDRTNVTVPAGIFKDSDVVMMTMAGYGPGAALAKANPLPRIQTKTTLSIMLGGTKMNGRRGR